jgi:hypothetical protein
MLTRYLPIHPYIDVSDQDIIPLLLSPLDHAYVESSIPAMKNLNDVTVLIQKENMDLYQSRVSL